MDPLTLWADSGRVALGKMRLMVRSTPSQVLGLVVIFVVSFGIAYLIDSRPPGHVFFGLLIFVPASACYVAWIKRSGKPPTLPKS